ncbi:MAG: hypothetical protein Q8R90_00550 [Bacteroidales bacterium]|nr:hypothetical protein [Bacteroidales bacterium]
MSSTTNLNLSYNLPDSEVMNSDSLFDFYIWQPDKIYIVLGRANSIEKSVFSEIAQRDGVRILKRDTGGESVVLSPSMLVFSSKITLLKPEKPGNIFRLINEQLINSFLKIGIESLYSKGISDISVNNKKILGSSMYLKGKVLFYHAVLNINEDVSLISKYLKHPTREPDYREGRAHNEFVTSLYSEGYTFEYNTIKEAVTDAFKKLYTILGANMN